MHSKPLFLALVLTGVTLASPLATPEGPRAQIDVQLLAPVNGVSFANDLSLTALVTNTGAQPLKILKYGSVLDNTRRTKSFKVTNGEDGTDVPFTGIKVCVAPPRCENRC